MPQLEKFTYFSQFFWLCLLFFSFYVAICNDGDGILGISRILKLRSLLLSQRENPIPSKDPKSLEDILTKSFQTGLSYMKNTFFEVGQWCKTNDLLGKRGKITLSSSFGEISSSGEIEKKLLYLIANSSTQTSESRIRISNIKVNEIMLIHLLHGHISI